MPKIKTRRKMGWIAIVFHWTMIFCTFGLWTPVYLAGRRRRLTVMHVPAGVQYAPGAYPSQQPYGQQPPPPPGYGTPPQR